MTTGAKTFLAAAAFFLAVTGGFVAYKHHQRTADDALPAPVKATYVADPDDEVILHHEHPMSLADEKSLKGKTLWVSAGGQLDYFPLTGHTVAYAKSAGTLLGAEPIVVTDAIEAVAPKSAAFRIPQGDRQILLVFHKPSADSLFAVPVGYRTGHRHHPPHRRHLLLRRPARPLQLLVPRHLAGD